MGGMRRSVKGGGGRARGRDTARKTGPIVKIVARISEANNCGRAGSE